jgi:hypothetical protein
MKPKLSVISRRLSAVSIAFAAVCTGPTLSAQTSLSIYSDGRIVVRKTLPQGLQRGRNQFVLQLEGLDPATLFSPDSTVTVTGATVRYASTQNDALARAVGQTLSFVRGKGDTIRATVVRVDPPQYRLADGRLLLSPAGEPLFPAELVRTAPEAVVALDAARARPNTQLAYVTQGVTWEATYQAVIGAAGAAATIGGAATVTSQALRTDSAEIQLVAGTINRSRTDQSKGYAPAAMAARAVMEQAQMPEEQAVGETHVYSLPAKLSLEPGVPVATALFPRATTGVTQELVVPGVLPWRGWVGQEPDNVNQVPVQVWYTFRRGRGTSFGDRPLPGGTMQLYQADAEGRVQLVGEATIGHTPAGKDVRVQSGDAFDVTAQRVQTEYNQEQIPPLRRGLAARQRITASYRVTVTNAKAIAVTVDVRESHFGAWKVVESSAPAEKLSSTETRFRLALPAGGETVLTYTVQIES